MTDKHGSTSFKDFKNMTEVARLQLLKSNPKLYHILHNQWLLYNKGGRK